MGYFEFPHTRTYDSDLGWLIRHVKKLIDCCDNMTDWKAAHEEEYEELLNKVNGLINSLTEIIKPWDPGVAYQIFSIVEYQGQNYIAIKDVPVGVMIGDPLYWNPANTTIEQINAISVLVSHILETWNVVEEFDDLNATTTERVIVLNDNGYYGSGHTVIYTISPWPMPMHISGGFQRANGDWMMPMPLYCGVTSNAPMGAISDVIGSYFNRQQLVYEQYSTNLPFNMDLPAGSMTGIDCTTFVNLILKAIPYENSRYLADNPDIIYGDYIGNNIPRNPKSTRPGLVNVECYKVSELGLFFAGQNRFYYIDMERPHPCSQLSPGDLVFTTRDDEGDGRYLHLSHIAMVLHVYPESDQIMIAQVGGDGNWFRTAPDFVSTVNISLLSLEDGDFRYFARPNYSVGRSSAKNITNYFRSGGTRTTPAAAGATSYLGAITFTEQLQPHKIYTIRMKGDFPDYETSRAYFSFNIIYQAGSGISGHTLYLRRIHPKHDLSFTFPGPLHADLVRNIEIYARVADSETEPITPEEVIIEEAVIYEGSLADAPSAGKNIQSVITNMASYVGNISQNFFYSNGIRGCIQLTIRVDQIQSGVTVLGVADPSIIAPGLIDRPFMLLHNNTLAPLCGILKATTNEVQLQAIPATGYYTGYINI